MDMYKTNIKSEIIYRLNESDNFDILNRIMLELVNEGKIVSYYIAKNILNNDIGIKHIIITSKKNKSYTIKFDNTMKYIKTFENKTSDIDIIELLTMHCPIIKSGIISLLNSNEIRDYNILPEIELYESSSLLGAFNGGSGYDFVPYTKGEQDIEIFKSNLYSSGELDFAISIESFSIFNDVDLSESIRQFIEDSENKKFDVSNRGIDTSGKYNIFLRYKIKNILDMGYNAMLKINR